MVERRHAERRTHLQCTTAIVAASLLGLGLASATPAFAACQSDWQDPRSIYGDSLVFKVLRDGTPVGYHRVDFRDQGSDVIVDTKFLVEIDFLFITAYRYKYESTEVWRDGCLAELRAITDDDGDRSSVNATGNGSGLLVTGPDGGVVSAPRLFPTNHWNSGVIGSEKVLNTITGQVDDVQIVDRGASTVTARGETVTAQRFTYTGDLDVDVWYDEEGRWVKMRFEKDGATIEYVCQQCGPGAAGRA